MSYRNRVVTVFGGSGFIGRHLISRLARTGAVVRIAVRHPAKANFLKTAGAVGQIVPIACDVRRDDSVALAVKDSDVVINLIGALYPTAAWDFPTVHVDAPARIARLAREAGADRMIHVSAIGADPQSAAEYARTKGQGEQAVLERFPDATILRPSIVFGPEDQFFNRFAAMAQVSPFLPLIGGGRTRFQPVYVGDVADAVMGAIDDPASKGRTFELGGPRVYTFKELMEITLKEIRRRRLLLPIPWNVAETMGGVMEKVPLVAPVLTRDQVELLKTDNVASGSLPGLPELGVEHPTAVEVIVPTYLFRFIVGGTYTTTRRIQGQFPE